ncbi:MAG: alpha/beta hydrolase domain-containing protein [SAR202 cluster bacterium]|jgi:hypothetical protein|nr:alpha/beta hydrolase domain-containing protein [SAR202 cluster bacterium]MDP6713855.1 alpha/beta hydrolase domain-containing protein [SAR202 cluster bacterium]
MPVVGFDLSFRRTLADGEAFGDVGPYEELRGTLRFAVDPLHEANVRITDIELAPRNDQGLVEFSSDVSVILPVDRSRANGRMMLDVVNRGNRVALPNFNGAGSTSIGPDTPIDAPVNLGNGFLMKEGYTVVACGWQGDTPSHPALITMDGPDALDSDGNPLTGRVYTQLQSPEDTPNFLLSDKGHRAYPALDMDEAGAVMEVRDIPDGPAYPVPRDFWRFGRIDENGDYVADPNYVCSEDGFEKGRLYQVVYTTVGAPILGLSFAALRDCISWVKHGTESAPTPIDGIEYAYSYGRSQTGRYLRTYIYNDLNLDEQGREAMDGIISNVAGGMRGEFNQRFGQNSKDRNNMLSQLFPFAPVTQTDTEIEETGSLQGRFDERGSSVRVMYTNTSAEYHRADASLLHTDPDGKTDIDLGPNARVYHFAGTEHGLGIWPPTDTTTFVEGLSKTQNLRGVVNYAPLLRACLVNLNRWVSQGVEPPHSSHPRLDDGTAMPPSALRPFFDRVPGANYPAHHALPHRRDYAPVDGTEYPTVLPPRTGGNYGGLVSAVDESGNELGGIRLPEISVPLASHTGWTLRHGDIGGETQLLMFAGGTIPLALTASERGASGDPRLSIAERYASKDDYLSRIRGAAESLVQEGRLLEQDIEVCLEQADKYWSYFTDGSASGSIR